ncbi:MAG: HAD-IC family P-type ATPase [Candidatus Methanomethylophilaceae archaeon]
MMPTGLTEAEVRERVANGQVNSVKQMVSRTYTDIIVKNACTSFNLLLFILGAVLVLLDEPVNALAATGVIFLNILIATLQEIRAKRRLDKIALLLRPKVTVIREGKESEIDQAEIVKDDLIHLRPGDQALVDGRIIDLKYLEMDESLLTGESKTVRKHMDDLIYSGSFCVTGEGFFRVTAFGNETFASKMLASAKKYTVKATPLQMETSAITKLLMSVAFAYLLLMIIVNIIQYHDFSEGFKATVTMAVIILDIVPIALFLLIIITYMIAAIRMADAGVLLQRSNSVESISHVDTICMDKTGTITTNKLVFHDMRSLVDEEEAETVIRRFVGSTGSKNHTVEALEKRFGSEECKVIEEIRFSSERKFSGVKIETEDGIETFFMGAFSSLKDHLNDDEVEGIVNSFSKKGLRTVVIAKGPDVELYDNDEITIPDLDVVSVVAISDEIRKDCRETIDVFLRNGMDLKVISGDDPVAVDSLFTIADIPGKRTIMSGEELDALDGDERTKAILETNIFGRMKPDHKELIIDTLKNNGKYVAMIGDGVNDVKSLKRANVGVALQSGSGAAIGVSDMVLVNDNFAALPKALVEGRKTVSGMRDILKLYLTRNFVLAFMITPVFFFFGKMPFLPTENTFYALATVSFAAFLMAIWAQPRENKGAILPGVLHYAIPTAALITLFGFLIYVLFYTLTMNGTVVIQYTTEQLAYLGWPTYDVLPPGIDVLTRTAEINARNAMLLFVVVAGITQMFMVTPYFRFFSVDGNLHHDIRPTLLAFLLYAFVYATYNWEFSARIISLAVFPLEYVAAILIAVVAWFFITRFMLRRGLFNFLTDITERWYRKKLDEAYSTKDD